MNLLWSIFFEFSIKLTLLFHYILNWFNILLQYVILQRRLILKRLIVTMQNGQKISKKVYIVF